MTTPPPLPRQSAGALRCSCYEWDSPNSTAAGTTDCHHRPMEYFTLAAKKPTSQDPGAVEAALRQAWNACAETACPKCHVPAGQYCRNSTAGVMWVTRFHRPRQDAAGVPQILPPVGINGLSWATGKGGFRWDDRRVPTV